MCDDIRSSEPRNGAIGGDDCFRYVIVIPGTGDVVFRGYGPI
jgi:hypothetical protein